MASSWDATENIIDQCFSGGEYNEDTTAFLGWWQLGTESYSIFIGKNEADIEPEVLDLDDGGQIAVEDPAPPVNTPTSERFLGRRK